MNTGLLYLQEYAAPQNFTTRPAGPGAKATQKLTVRERVITALQQKGDVPAFPVTAHRLLELAKQPNVDLNAVAEVVRLDPGIASRILKVASSPAYAGQTISTLEEALLMIGIEEMKRIVTSLSVINTFRHMRVKVNWDLFWLHSLLTARLTEILVYAYREVDGREYLAGLLHDVGKLFLQHNFPQEFEMVVIRAMASREGMYAAENKLLDITHAEASALLCHRWHLQHEVIGAVQFHHEPGSPLNVDPNDPGYQPFLSYCLCVADKLANLCHANIGESNQPAETSLESMPEWIWLQQYQAVRSLSLDVAGEFQKTREIISAMKGPSAAAKTR